MTVPTAPATNTHRPRLNNGTVLGRQILNGVVLVLATAATLFGLFWLIWILFTTVSRGLPALKPALFTIDTKPTGAMGGLRNAFVGSLIMVGLGVLIAVPIGTLAGVYLAEFARRTRFGFVVRFTNDILLSAPSILIGLFIYQLVVAHSHHYAGFAGGLALAVILLPVIVRTSDEALQLVPANVREAGLALGLPKWKINSKVIVRAASTGIITGVLLGVARIAGETAPLLFTALGNQYFSTDLNRPMASVPIVMNNYAPSAYDDWNATAWAGALVITLFVLVLGICVRLFFKRGTAK